MSLRADRSSSGETAPVPSDVLGGLVTHLPAHRVPPNASPDLKNVVMHRGAAQKRGGFAPLVRQQPGVCSLRNVGYHVVGRSQSVLGASNTDYVTVPGCAYAGHRSVWNESDVRNGLTLDMFLTIGDLTTVHGGNATTGSTPFGPAPYTIAVRPILSKGPIKRTAEPTSQVMPGTDGWQLTSLWGDIGAANHAMPLALYLVQSAGIWSIAFSFHYREGGNWHTKTLSTDMAATGGLRKDVIYHVVAGYDIAQNTCVLRVRTWFDFGAPAAVNVVDTIATTPTAIPNATPTPVQLFDFPQEFVEAPSSPSATRPPGLGLGGAAAGGYWFASKRFEGQVEDIVLYRGLVADIDTGSLDRFWRLEPSEAVGTIFQHWPVESETDNLVDETSGVGNHFYKNPSLPFFSPNGGLGGGALTFNGTTSYALVEMSSANPVDDNWSDGRGGNTNWRTEYTYPTPPTPVLPGAWEDNVKAQRFHGLEVAFWPESIEPNHEQVVAEAHGAIRIVVTWEGFIKFYTRDANSWPSSAGYVNGGVSGRKIVPGQRYHVIAARVDGTTTQLWVNGTLEASLTVTANSDPTWPVSGLTIGAGAKSLTSNTARSDGTADADTPTSDQINTDTRTMFMGRVEFLRVLVGSLPTGVGGVQTNRVTRVEDYTIAFQRLFTLAVGSVTSPDESTIPKIGPGHVVVHSSMSGGEGLNARPITSTATSRQYLANIPAYSSGGPYPLQLADIRIFRTLGCWDFDAPTPDTGLDNAFPHRIEYRDRLVSNYIKHVAVQRGYVSDIFGLTGDVQLRCVQPDLLTESAANYATPAWNHQNTPYNVRGPAALAPRWDTGLLSPVLGTNPIAMLADWTLETTEEVLVMAACRRSLYWVRPPWSEDSPFRDRPGSLSLLGISNDRAVAKGLAAIDAGSSWDVAEAVFDCWVRPDRLDGYRVVACSGTSLNETIRYMVVLLNGQLQVLGQLDGGWVWRWIAGDVDVSPSRNQQAVAVRLQAWNHLAVRIGDSAVSAWINGQAVKMVDGAPIGLGDSILASSIPAATDYWVGGVSRDQEDMRLAEGGGISLVTLAAKPFCGQIAQVRENSDLSSLDLAVGGSSPMPPEPALPADRFTWNMDDASGWKARPSVGAIPLDVSVNELVTAASDLPDAGRTQLDALVFRQRLLMTTTGRPRSTVFVSKFEDTRFVVSPLGVLQPPAQLLSYQDPAQVAFAPPGSTFAGTERIDVYVSFVNGRTGEESERSLVAIKKGPGTPQGFVEVNNLPTSPDPGVTSRRVYFIVDSSGGFVFAGEVFDNLSRSTVIYSKIGQGLTAPAVATHLPAEPCRRIAIDQGSVILVGLRANPNAILISGDSPGHFELITLTALDSEDGQGLVGVAAMLGGLFVFKRNGTWQVQIGAGQVSLRLINASAGCAGGTAVYDNVTYGANERGIWACNGSQFTYVSASLEGDYENVDVREDGLLAQRGSFYYPHSQYWLSVRRDGEDANRSVYVFHQGGQFTKLDLPPHLTIATISGNRMRPVMAIGTIHGQILRMTDEQSVDGILDQGAGTELTGTGIPDGATRLTAAGSLLEVHGPGLRGVAIDLLDPDGVFLGAATIRRNTATSITWDAPVMLPAEVQFEIGGIDAYWSSPWLGPQQVGSWVKVEGIDLSFDPRPASMTLTNQSASRTVAAGQAFQVADSESRDVDMTLGYMEQPKPTNLVRQGAYHRIRFGSRGPRRPFAVTLYAIRFAPVGTRGRPS